MNAKSLAEHRVMGEGRLSCHAAKMTQEEILERRSYIRKALRGSNWNLNNDQMDGIRLMEESGGYILEDENGYLFAIRGSAVTKEEAEFRKVRAMMPFDFMNLTGKDFLWCKYQEDTTIAKELTNRFIMKFQHFRKEGMGLYICSSVKGSGKTMLSCCILNEITKRYKVAVKFINSMDLLELTKKVYKGNDPEELQALYDVSVLVIDDIGVQMSKEWIDTVFYRLINSRYSNKLVTIYTSNISSAHLKMDDRIIDRIESTTYPLMLPEESIRSQIRKQKKEDIMETIKNTPV